MAWNGKPAKTSTTDYTNLLYTDSDSDRVPDLKLPPVKGKKQKRKKGLPSRQDEASCSTWSVLKVILGIVILGAVTALAIISFWSLQRISDLQDKISELQNMDSTSPDIINIQSQLAAFNRTVDSLKTGDGGIKTILEDIAVIKEKLKTLEESTKKLEPAISASEDLLSVPEKLKSLTEIVASIGSEVNGIKNSDIVSKSEKMSSRLTALETLVDTSSSPAPVTADVDNQLGSMLQEQVANLKLSISSEVTRINKTLEQQETRVSLLENFTSKNVKPELDVDAIHDMVSLAVEEKLGNMTSEVSPSEGGQRLSQGQLAELQKQMDSIMEEVTQIQQTSDAQVDKGTFMVLKDDFISDFKDINTSLLTLTSDVDVMANRLDLVDQTLVNITNVIHGVLTKESLLANAEPKLLGDETPKPDHESLDVKTTTSTSTTSTSTADTTTTTATNDITQREESNISIPGISSLEDLQKVFTTVWPVTEGGEVDLNSLNKLLGTEALDVNIMQQYDLDNNGFYSEEEMALALGLKNRTRR